MHISDNPRWIDNFIYDYKYFEEIPVSVFEQININLDRVQSTNPKVSIVIAAWNEEVNLLASVGSLSQLRTKVPFEIIVVNNNSTDNTQQTLDRLHVKALFEGRQGAGPARQKGQEHARGDYILTADADCIYPSCWLDAMVKGLERPDVACVYGRYSFIGSKELPRWKFAIMEKMKDVVAEIRHFRRPYLNTYGMSMGYKKDYGLKIGFITENVRGEDGRFAFDLMQYGKVIQIKSNKARVWTAPRTIIKDGTIENAIRVRVLRELRRFCSMFFPHPPHDTKTSTND